MTLRQETGGVLTKGSGLHRNQVFVLFHTELKTSSWTFTVTGPAEAPPTPAPMFTSCLSTCPHGVQRPAAVPTLRQDRLHAARSCGSAVPGVRSGGAARLDGGSDPDPDSFQRRTPDDLLLPHHLPARSGRVQVNLFCCV